MGCTKSKPIALKAPRKNSFFRVSSRKNRIQPVSTSTETFIHKKDGVQSSLSNKSVPTSHNLKTLWHELDYRVLPGVPDHVTIDSDESDRDCKDKMNAVQPVTYDFLTELRKKRERQEAEERLMKLKIQRHKVRANKELKSMLSMLQVLEKVQPKVVEYEEKYTGFLKTALKYQYDDELQQAVRSELKANDKELKGYVVRKYQLLRCINIREARADLHLGCISDEEIGADNSYSLTPIREETRLELLEWERQ